MRSGSAQLGETFTRDILERGRVAGTANTGKHVVFYDRKGAIVQALPITPEPTFSLVPDASRGGQATFVGVDRATNRPIVVPVPGVTPGALTSLVPSDADQLRLLGAVAATEGATPEARLAFITQIVQGMGIPGVTPAQIQALANISPELAKSLIESINRPSFVDMLMLNNPEIRALLGRAPKLGGAPPEKPTKPAGSTPAAEFDLVPGTTPGTYQLQPRTRP